MIAAAWQVSRFQFYEALFVADRMQHQVLTEIAPRCVHVSRQHYRNILKSGWGFRRCRFGSCRSVLRNSRSHVASFSV